MSCFLLAVALAVPDLSEIMRGFEATQRKHTGFCCLVTMTKGQAEQSKQTVARLYKINDSWRIVYLQTPLAGTPIFAPGNPGVTSGYLVRKDKIIQYVRSPSRSTGSADQNLQPGDRRTGRESAPQPENNARGRMERRDSRS